VTEADVPERKAGPAVLPFVVPLERYVGRSILVEVAHRGSDDQSFVEWAALGPTSAPEARAASSSK